MQPFLQAAAIAEYFLGKRPAECTAGFSMILYRYADEASSDEVLDNFSSTSEADTPEGEAATRGSFKKLKTCAFLRLLCKEAQRLQYAIRDAIPRLFRDNDGDHDGYISRRVEPARLSCDFLHAQYHAMLLTSTATSLTCVPSAMTGRSSAPFMRTSMMRIRRRTKKASGRCPCASSRQMCVSC